MATVTPGYTFTNNEVVTPAKLNSASTPIVAVANGEITLEKLAAAVQHFLVPAGAVMPFAMNSAPSGWLAANGSEYSKTGTYAALFAVIGTTYGETNGVGGTGTTHFRVPDLRGYFVRGSGPNSDGIASGAFGAKQADAVINHTHSGTTKNDNLSSKISNLQSFGGSSNNILIQSAVVNSNPIIFHQHDFTTNSQDPAGTTETRPRNIAMLYCIKA